MIKKFVGLMIVVLSSPLMATSYTGEIDDLKIWHNGHLVLKLKDVSPSGCNSTYFSMGDSGVDSKADPMYSMALAAFISNKQITITTNDSDRCYRNEHKIHSLDLNH